MTPRDEVYGGRALVAAFGDVEDARAAARALRDEGFDAWIGVTHGAAGDAPADESIGSKIGRFFSGSGPQRSLHEELVRHGLAPDRARRLEAALPPDSAVLTVDGSNHPELASEIVEEAGGHIVAGEALGTTGIPAGAEAVRGSQVLGYGDAARYARGAQIDEQRRIALREERLRIDKRTGTLGEARIVKDVVEHRQDVDVPVVHEELFVERRPVAETDAINDDVAPIADGETIRIPLMKEVVAVTKRPVVTGEVVVGKQRVVETQRVAETTREERVLVDGPEGAINARGYDGDSATR